MNFIKIAFPLANVLSFAQDLKTKQAISSAPHFIGQHNLAHSLRPLKWKQNSNINTGSNPIPLWHCLPTLVSICLHPYLTFSSFPVSTSLILSLEWWTSKENPSHALGSTSAVTLGVYLVIDYSISLMDMLDWVMKNPFANSAAASPNCFTLKPQLQN